MPMSSRRVLVDDRTINSDCLTGLSVGDAIREIIQKFLPEDRVLEEILVDGTPVFQDGHYDDGPFPDGEEIRIRTGNLEEVLRESIRTLISHLSQVARLFSEIGRELRKGKVEQVFGGEGAYKDRGGPYVQGIEAMVSAQVLVDQVQIIMESGTSFASKEPLVLIEEENKFEELLKGMLVAQENQDWVLLADLIEYELVPVFEKGLASAEQYYQSVSVVEIR